MLFLPTGHPATQALMQAQAELDAAHEAAVDGNAGRARVSARRAVAVFMQAVAGALPFEAGTHAMANLRAVADRPAAPDDARAAAGRLLGGPRSIAAGNAISEDPITDATLIIRWLITIVDAAP